MLIQLLSLAFGMVILVLGADFLVKGAVRIAEKYKVSPLVIGLTIVAFGTSAPELFVSLGAALKGSSDVAVGNIIGSNICNILCILGVASVISSVSITKDVYSREMPLMLLSLLLFWIFSLNENLGRFEGVVLFSGIIAYLTYNFFFSESSNVAEEETSKVEVNINMYTSLGLILLGLTGMVWGADLIVVNASKLARAIGVSEMVIGITIIGIGTSLPELATTAVAAMKDEVDLAIGNAIGSNIFNVFSVIGLTSIVHPLTVSKGALVLDFPFMFFSCAIVGFIMFYKKSLTRLDGILMLFVYFSYIIFNFSGA